MMLISYQMAYRAYKGSGSTYFELYDCAKAHFYNCYNFHI